MNAFELIRPATLDAAVAAFRAHDEAMYLSGGMTLVPSLKAGLAAPGLLVDLSGIEDLHGISLQGDRLRIGALTRFADLAASAEAARVLPALGRMVETIADRHVRNRGTLGGSLANNDPAADFPAAALALGATLVTDRRRIEADDYFTGLFSTALDEGEILAAIELPVPLAAAYAKHEHPASGYAVAGVFVARFADGLRIAVTGSGEDGVFRLTRAEEVLGQDPQADPLTMDIGDPALLDDRAFPADFRAAAIRWLLRDALAGL